ncbi:hypothetical protein GQ464_003195 [Rhodocaloribacter litoris]|uniref:hypothetical protein n=1 Tax=Rhodocaloribacter litoris TaxID=2558931 RepID=UPI0014232F7F|nr:hypothetical protein [Rhodocaloribacter litoris]QXD15970.1 hypothetical protein GQ464_003195 [Rhodocaloribacter litoris]
MKRCYVLPLVLLLPVLSPAQSIQDRLYGTVTTRDGEVFEGLIRWDKNEVSWVDLLDGSKRLTGDERPDRSIRIFGIRIDMGNADQARQSGLRFGHLRSLENTGSDRALLTLRSGKEVELRGGSTDIGHENRGILVEDERAGLVELRWRDLERVDFAPTPRRLTSRFGERLYGTLTTRNGLTFTGYICWDVDEVLTTDELDGRDEHRRRRSIPFGDIAEIARESSRSARVRLKNGEVLVLGGTNDVNDDNRDILVLDPGLGQVRIPWNAFDRLRFESPGRGITYMDFPSTGPLYGTLTTRNGDKFTGYIRWDDDETETWEMLNGEADDVGFAIEFGLIREIERRSSRAARVTLRDGRTFELRGSNDVNSDNNGIIVRLASGDVKIIDWPDFNRLVLEK